MDLREFLKKLEEVGELKVIDQEVDWNLEASAITAMTMRLDGPAVLFNRIKGYSQGRLAAEFFQGARNNFWRRFSIGLDMDPEIKWEEFSRELYERLKNPIKPVLVSTGPCKENILIGKDVNLFAFPWPYIHDGDGGRYGTILNCITKDLGSAWVNWGNYRMQIQTKNKVGFQLGPFSDAGTMYYQGYEPRGQNMPFCVSLGGEPAVTMMGVFDAPKGVSEVELAGAAQQKPVEMVRAETNDLLVPANAEIVLEGEIRPYERMDEGPFGEMIGYMHGPRSPRPVGRINCITYRTNPIIPFNVEGTEGGDNRGLTQIFTSGIDFGLKQKGIPVDYYWQRTGDFGFPTVTFRFNYPGFSWVVASGVISYSLFQWLHTTAFFDPADYSPDDLDGFIESIFLKAHPTNWHVTDSDHLKMSVSVFQSPEEKKRGLSAKTWIDATWPATWRPEEIPKKVAFENCYPAEIQEWTVREWKRLGFKERPLIKKGGGK